VTSQLEQLQAEGFVVLRDAAGPDLVRRFREELAPYLATAPFGRNDFEGFRSQRLYALLAKARSTAELVAHPAVLELVDAVLDAPCLLSANIAINVHPGETAQSLHPDDGYCGVPRPRRPFGVSAVWAIDEFTAENGATEVLPSSHLFGSEPIAATDPRIRPIEMSPGSVVVFLGTTLHRGGANRSSGVRLGLTPQYCQPWMRQIENMTLAVPPDVVATLPERVQELLGYSILPPFIGYVDGQHPRRILDTFSRAGTGRPEPEPTPRVL
jgi:ectoine hydroxylase-related dioxygenase (phytanoyl-CoA dioxygenase family)